MQRHAALLARTTENVFLKCFFLLSKDIILTCVSNWDLNVFTTFTDTDKSAASIDKHFVKIASPGVNYDDVIMGTIASQITSLMTVYSTVYSDADQRKHQSSASPAFVRGIHRGPVNSPHKWPVTRKMFPFDDVIMVSEQFSLLYVQHHDLYLSNFTSIINMDNKYNVRGTKHFLYDW